MKVLKNTLKVKLETWNDPGDYPSGAGGGPLPSVRFVSAINGTVMIEVSQEDLDECELNSAQSWVSDPENAIRVSDECELIDGLKVTEWKVLAIGVVDGGDAVLILAIKEFKGGYQ